MKRFYRLALLLGSIAVIIALLLILVTEYYLELSEPEGYRNSQICPTLKPGITVEPHGFTAVVPLVSWA
jgi:hypothetical protein